MNQITLDTLTELLRKAAGEEETVDLNGNILDVPFADLGYDSLAMLELAGMVEREYQISLSDDTVQEAETPRQLLTMVNDLLVDAA